MSTASPQLLPADTRTPGARHAAVGGCNRLAATDIKTAHCKACNADAKPEPTYLLPLTVVDQHDAKLSRAPQKLIALGDTVAQLVRPSSSRGP